MTSEKYFPRDLSTDDQNHERFKELVDGAMAEKISPFYKKDMKDVFMYALGIGFSESRRLKLKKKVPTIPVRSLDQNDLALIKAIAVVEKGSLDIICGENIKEIFDIAEEYANGGIAILHDMIFGDEPGDVDVRMEKRLREILDRQKS